MTIAAVLILTILIGYGLHKAAKAINGMDEPPTEYDDAYNEWHAKKYGVEKWEE